MQKNNVTAVILAGGQSRRMGRHKALLTYKDSSFLDSLIQQLTGMVSQVLVGGCPEPDLYLKCGVTVIEDPSGFEQFGPLAGLLSAMNVIVANDTPANITSDSKASCSTAQTNLLLCVPCDNPRLPTNLLANLTVVMNREGADIAYVYDGERIQPLYALMKVELKDSLQHYLLSGGKRVLQWMRAQNAVAVDFSQDQSMFCNINSVEEYDTFLMENLK